MLPMGTIVAACMFIGVLAAAEIPLIRKLPSAVMKFLGLVVFAAGAWNVLWYALRHITEFWGLAALVSGLLMLITSGYLLAPNRMPGILAGLKPLVLALLFCCGLLYAITIARL